MDSIFGQHLLFDPYIKAHGNVDQLVMQEFIENIKNSNLDNKLKKSLNDHFKQAINIYNDSYKCLQYITYNDNNSSITIPKDYKKLIKPIKKHIRFPLLISSGYSTQYEGHSIMIYIKNNNTNFEIKLYNSGEGINTYHENNYAGIAVFILNKQQLDYLLAHIVWMNIAHNDTINKYNKYLTIDTFYLRIIEIIQKNKCEFYNNDTEYEEKNIENNYKFKVVTPKQPQFSGSCTFYSKIYWIEEKLGKEFDEFMDNMRRKYLIECMDEIKEQKTINDYNLLQLIKYNYSDLLGKHAYDNYMHTYETNLKDAKINIEINNANLVYINQNNNQFYVYENEVPQTNKLYNNIIAFTQNPQIITAILEQFKEIYLNIQSNSSDYFKESVVILFGKFIKAVYNSIDANQQLIIEHIDELINVLELMIVCMIDKKYIIQKTSPHIINIIIKTVWCVFYISLNTKYKINKIIPSTTESKYYDHSVSFFVNQMVDDVLLFDQNIITNVFTLLKSIYDECFYLYNINYSNICRLFNIPEIKLNNESVPYNTQFEYTNLYKTSTTPSLIKIFYMFATISYIFDYTQTMNVTIVSYSNMNESSNKKIQIFYPINKEKENDILIMFKKTSETHMKFYKDDDIYKTLNKNIYVTIEMLKNNKIYEINNYKESWLDVLQTTIIHAYKTILNMPKLSSKMIHGMVSYNSRPESDNMCNYISDHFELINQLKDIILRDVKELRIDFIILCICIKLLYGIHIDEATRNAYINIISENINNVIYGTICKVLLILLNNNIDEQMINNLFNIYYMAYDPLIKYMVCLFMCEKYDYNTLIRNMQSNDINTYYDLFKQKYPNNFIDELGSFVLNNETYKFTQFNFRSIYLQYMCYYNIKNKNKIIIELESTKLTCNRVSVFLNHGIYSTFILLMDSTSIPQALIDFYSLYIGPIDEDYFMYIIGKEILLYVTPDGTKFMMEILYNDLKQSVVVVCHNNKLYIDDMELNMNNEIATNKWIYGMKNCYIVTKNNETKILIKHEPLNSYNDKRIWTGSDYIYDLSFKNPQKYYLLHLHDYGLTLHGDLDALKVYLQILILHSNYELIYILLNKYKMFMYDVDIKNLFAGSNNPFHYYFNEQINEIKEDEVRYDKIKIRSDYYFKKFIDTKIDWKQNINYNFIEDMKSLNLDKLFLAQYINITPIEKYNKIDECKLIKPICRTDLMNEMKRIGEIAKDSYNRLNNFYCNDYVKNDISWNNAILNKLFEPVYRMMYCITLITIYEEIYNISDKDCVDDCTEIIDYYNRINLHKYYNGPKNKFYIMFELLFGKFIRNDQMQIINNIMRKPKEIHQLLMGRGKTTVIAPFLALTELHNNNSAIMIMPEHLLNQSFKIMSKFDLLFENNCLYDANNNFNELESKNKNNIYMLSNTQAQNYLLQNVMKNTNFKLHNTILILDEIDNMLNPMTSELNIPIEEHTVLDKNLLSMYECLTDMLMNKQTNNVNNLIEEYKNNVNWKFYYNYNLSNKINNLDIKQYFLCDKIKKTMIECLKMKFRKQYDLGYSIKESVKNDKLAIPYSAVDHPMNGSEFTDTDITAILTILTYMYNGLSIDNINAYIDYTRTNFDNEDDFKEYLMDRKYNDNSMKNMLKLAKLEKNKRVMADIEKLKDDKILLREYIMYVIKEYLNVSKNNYNSSFMDVINTKFCEKQYGFSGTINIDLPKCNECTINKYIFDSEEKNIDDMALQHVELAINLYNAKVFNKGKFIMINEIKDVYNIINKYDALIDACGYFRDYNAESVAIKIKDITNKTIIYWDKHDNKQIETGTENSFIYYDNKHILGIDIEQKSKMLGLVLISEDNALTDTSQAIFRLRKLNMGHNVDFGIVDTSLMTKIKDNKYNLYQVLDDKEKQVRKNTRPRFLIQNIKTNERIQLSNVSKYKNEIYNLLDCVGLSIEKIKGNNLKTYNDKFFYLEYLKRTLNIKDPLFVELSSNNYFDNSISSSTEIQMSSQHEKKTEKEHKMERKTEQQDQYFGILSFSNYTNIKIDNYLINDYNKFKISIGDKYNHEQQLISLNNIQKYNIYISYYWLLTIKYGIDNKLLNRIDGYVLYKNNQYLIITSREFSILNSFLKSYPKIKYITKYSSFSHEDQKPEFIIKLILCGIYNIALLKQFYSILSDGEYTPLIRALIPDLNILYNTLIPFSYILKKFGDVITMDDLEYCPEFYQTNVKNKTLFLEEINKTVHLHT
jgi:DNA-binding transcriptional MerR regulator